ncbi:MAG TPA: PAS domain S-box protein [Thermoanaerobaculia bacterium]|nr:PAS domain S-box protein [Thermoanaerobaculia bacterium]
MNVMPSCAAVQQDDRLSRLLDALPAIAWSASANTFRFNYINPAAEKILGYPASRWLEEPNFWSQHLHPEDRHVVRLCHNETLACRNHELVYRMIAADGRIVWIRDYVNVYSVEGEPVELFGIMIDITREREAETAWKESRENFRRMVALSPDCIGVHADGKYLYVNQSFVELLGALNEAQIVGRSVLSIVDPAYHEAMAERLERLAAGENVPYVREKFRRVDGSLVDVEVAALPLRYDNRDAIQVIARDVTDRVRSEQALEASERRYRELVEGVSEILYTVDEEGRIVSLSRSFERSTGYHAEEWIGLPFSALFQARAAAGDAGEIGEYELLDRSGAVVTLEVSSQPRYVDGVAAGTVGIARDVTESRNNARKLEEAKRMSSLGQVAASLAHEFNNVLMGIQPFVEVIARNPNGPRVSESLSHITRSIGRGKRASQEILRFANPKDPQLSAIDVRTWLPTFLDDLSASLPASIALESSMAADVHLVRGDCQHLEQVITNLVFNARDAIGADGTIEVRVSRTGQGMVRISVCDDGPGIAPGMADRIFEPLFTTKRNGTGLGLAIAQRLMERQGGSLAAENRRTGGSAFHVFIPVVYEEAEPAKPAAPRANPAVRRILLVEDDVSAGTGLEELLRAEGYETTWVKLAGDACEAARRVQPQVAIIDMNLPDGNGADLVSLLRAGQEHLPVVLSTGHVEIGHADEEDGIVSLMKPYELGVLLDAISRVTAVA